jgi:hypothetical protein
MRSLYLLTKAIKPHSRRALSRKRERSVEICRDQYSHKCAPA